MPTPFAGTKSNSHRISAKQPQRCRVTQYSTQKQNRHPREASAGERRYGCSTRPFNHESSDTTGQLRPTRTDHSESVTIDAESLKFSAEVRVAATDQADAMHVGRTIGGQCGDKMAEAATHLDRAIQRLTTLDVQDVVIIQTRSVSFNPLLGQI